MTLHEDDNGWWVLVCETCKKEWHCGLYERAVVYREEHRCAKG